MNRVRGNKKGFTLIELMIVVVIIGILAALAIPRFMRATTKTKQAEVNLILKQIYVNQRTYRQQSVPSTYYNPAGAASTANPLAFGEIWVEIMGNCQYTFTMNADNTSFTCTATANIDDDATIDTWTIDENGVITNVTNDVTT